MSLVLVRRLEEAVLISGGSCTVRIIGVERDRVKLAFDGPATVIREELASRLSAIVPASAQPEHKPAGAE